jgi:HK97 gp10 family phage protein
MGIQATPTLNLRLGPLLTQMKTAVMSAVTELFEEEIVPTAKDLSPVTPEGYARNEQLKAEHKLGGRRVGGTGTNRGSIESTVTDVPEGVKAEMYTTSGYGGYLELGTSKMRAQPFLNPAFEQHIGKLPEKVKEKLGG